MLEIKFAQRLRFKIALAFLLFTIFIIGIFSFTMYRQSYSMFVKNVGEKALNITKISAEGINIEEFKNLKVVADMKKESYKKMVNELNYIRKIGGAKYLYVLRKNEDGDFFYVLDAEDNEEEICEIGEIENDESYDLAWQGESFYENEIWLDQQWGAMLCAFSPLKDKNGEIIGVVGVDYDAEEEYKTFQKIKRNIILISLGIIIVAFLLGRLIAKKISKPIEKVTEIANKIANYDLEIDNINGNSKGEIGILLHNFDQMVKNIRVLINDIKQTTINLRNTSQIIAASSEEVSASSEEVLKGIQVITLGATDQAIETNNSLEIANQLSNIIKRMLDILKLGFADVTEMKEKNELGMNSIKTLYDSFENEKQVRNEVAKSVQELLEKSKLIDKIVKTIKSIAAQTNILALNASIEAARAGEHGKGFAVVAGEVSKLAEQSSDATQEISNILKEITQIVNTTNDVMNDVIGVADIADTHLEQTKEVFGTINLSADKVSRQIELLYKDIDFIENAKENVLESIESISMIAQQAEATTQEVSSSAEEQTVSIEEIASSIQHVNDMINKLSELVVLFKV